eukprot:2311857-Rhodomonas_salina.1
MHARQQGPFALAARGGAHAKRSARHQVLAALVVCALLCRLCWCLLSRWCRCWRVAVGARRTARGARSEARGARREARGARRETVVVAVEEAEHSRELSPVREQRPR